MTSHEIARVRVGQPRYPHHSHVCPLPDSPHLSVGSLTLLCSSLQPILISRFLSNLRTATEPEAISSEGPSSGFTLPEFRVPTFNEVLDNMGEDLSGETDTDSSLSTSLVDTEDATSPVKDTQSEHV